MIISRGAKNPNKGPFMLNEDFFLTGNNEKKGLLVKTKEKMSDNAEKSKG